MNKEKAKIPEALQGAFIVVLGQNALLLSKPIFEFGKTLELSMISLLIVFISLINLFNIAANWISSYEVGQSEVSYGTSHLFWDILILAIFFVFTQGMSDYLKNELIPNISSIAVIIGTLYLILNLLYYFWNIAEIRNQIKNTPQKQTIKTLKKANIRNIISFALALLLLLSGLIGLPILINISFLFWVLNWVFVIVAYLSQNKLFG